MDKNKSIDGLKSRRVKKTTSKSTTPKKVAKSSTTKRAPKATPKRITNKTKKTTTTKKPIKTQSTKSTQINPITTEETTPINPNEDFLTPVQAFNFNEESGKLEATTPQPIKTKPKPMSKNAKLP